jgi:hypothetical protein
MCKVPSDYFQHTGLVFSKALHVLGDINRGCAPAKGMNANLSNPIAWKTQDESSESPACCGIPNNY